MAAIEMNSTGYFMDDDDDGSGVIGGGGSSGDDDVDKYSSSIYMITFLCL